MQEKNIYYPLWGKYKAAIVSKLKAALTEEQSFSIPIYEFQAFGDRQKSDYDFNIEVSENKVVNDISGSAVARDFMDVIRTSPTACLLLREHYFKINMSKTGLLKIRKLKQL